MIHHGPVMGGSKVFAREETRGNTWGKTNMKKNYKIRKLQFYIGEDAMFSSPYIIGNALVGFQCVFQGSYIVLFLKISRHIQ